jgi:hypothetical protein
MKVSSLLIPLAFVASTSIAMAQSSPSPNNQSGPGVDPRVQTPTDQSAGSESGNLKGQPSRMGTTGTTVVEPGVAPRSGVTIGEQHMRNASPASPAEGVEKEK